MVKYIFTSILVLTTGLMAQAKVDRVHSESYLGEKRLDSYSDRYQPLIYQDIYQGKMSFEDEIFFQNFFSPYLFQKESEYSSFLRSELNGGLVCSNELLSDHFDEIRYSYRLITLSYLLEGAWHMKLVSDHLKLKNTCGFNLSAWAKSCRPKSPDMKSFVGRLEKFSPKYEETLPVTYKKEDWIKEFKKNDFKLYSHYRMNVECKGKCSDEEIASRFQKTCEADQRLMTLLCSEEDEIYGLSTNRDAYFLIGQSNIINTYNKQGEAMGCLRRFSELMAHKEVRYEVLNQLFPSLQTFLRQKYQERFLQGRVFFYGAGKEFEEKGLTDVYVKDQPFKVEKLPTVAAEVDAPKVVKAPEVKTEVKVEVKPEPVQPKPVVKEIRKPVKSAFLLAAEIRSGQNLEQVEVDMLKLKYDYVFSLNMINTLSERLKTFMTRDALSEMMAYDKLGSKEGPVPLMFIKYMIDMQEHHGLWNIISVLGDKFYVSNEIDSEFSPAPEMVQLVNNQATGNQWQLYIIRP
ncbi:DEAD/DEAH box helicase family protein [Peredibacter starrii]|uniref:Uncharacterized protein n=1 Tax=Peredibacter starrii TaxID=28202 RepID=A0AAX4HLI0_9BACT|nr:hypothetical protein [Peredibacter starrii]WPU64050.1 hypothetical protein SOO65_15240 [Peredibacter starrii]